MKIKNIKKLLIKNLILCGSLLLISNIESYAIGGSLDLTHKSIVRNFGGSGDEYFYSTIETSDKGIVAVGYSNSTNAGFTNKGSNDAIVVKYDSEGNQQWIKNFGGSGSDVFNSVIETSDKGIVAVGYSNSTNAGFSNKGSYDAIMVKYDSEGNQLWIKNFGGSGDDYFKSVVETSDKGIVTVGYSSSTNAGFASKGRDDAIMVKYDSEGNQQWIKNFGGSGYDYFNSVIETSDRGIVAVGYSSSTNAGFNNKGYDDAIMVKYDRDGNQLWVKSFGGSDDDNFKSVIEISDGGIIAVGCSYSTNAGFATKGGSDATMVKYDKDGNQLWVKSFGGSDDDYFSSVIETSDKEIVAVGESWSEDIVFANKGKSDAIMVKYDNEGNQLWIKIFGGSGSDYFYSMVETSNRDLIAVGYSNSIDASFKNGRYSDAIIVKYNLVCEENEDLFIDVEKLNININQYDYFNSVIETSDKGVIAVGESNSENIGITNKGGSDAIVVKYDSEGNQLWIKNFGGSGYDYFNSVIETSDKGIVAVGYSDSTNAGFASKGRDDAIVVKYDSEGNQLWVKNFGGSGDDYFKSVIETSDRGIVAVGYSSSTNAGFANKGGYDAIMVKYDKDGNQLWIKSFGGSNHDYFESVIEMSDKGIVAVGYSSSTNAGFTNKGSADAIVVKYDKDGNQLWAKNFGGSSYDCFNSVIETSDKGIVVVGRMASTNAGFINKGRNDAVVVKYDKDGNQLWVKNFGGASDDVFNSVIETSDNGIVAIGYSNSTDAGFSVKGDIDAIVVKYDSEGNQQWIKNFGGTNTDYFYSVIETSDRGIVAVGYSWSEDVGFDNKGVSDAIMVKFDKDGNQEQINSIKIKNQNNSAQLEIVREQLNKLPEGELKTYLNDKVNSFNIGFGELELKTASANLDIYIKCENMLLMSLDTNSVTFEDFSGIEDMIKENAVNITINSSLPYQLNAYLPMEIQNSDKTNTMDKRILNIKENSEVDYKEFANINEKVVLKDNCSAGNDLVHGVDLKLVGGIAHEKDIYKTTIKFEAEQK